MGNSLFSSGTLETGDIDYKLKEKRKVIKRNVKKRTKKGPQKKLVRRLS